MIVWCTIVGVLLFTLVFRAIESYFAMRRHHAGSQHHHLVIEVGKERDVFFVPGDADDDDNED